MDFYFPLAYQAIDWTHPHTFLAQELAQIVRDREIGKRRIARLVQVTSLNSTFYHSRQKIDRNYEGKLSSSGEAAINIPAKIRLYSPELPWRLMGDLRNIVAHEYFRVDSEVVWDIAILNES